MEPAVVGPVRCAYKVCEPCYKGEVGGIVVDEDGDELGDGEKWDDNGKIRKTIHNTNKVCS